MLPLLPPPLSALLSPAPDPALRMGACRSWSSLKVLPRPALLRGPIMPDSEAELRSSLERSASSTAGGCATLPLAGVQSSALPLLLPWRRLLPRTLTGAAAGCSRVGVGASPPPPALKLTHESLLPGTCTRMSCPIRLLAGVLLAPAGSGVAAGAAEAAVLLAGCCCFCRC